MTRHKKIGLGLLLAPIILLIIAFVGNAVARSYMSSTMVTPTLDNDGYVGLAQPTSATSAAMVVKVIFSLVGMLGVIGLIICVPLSIYYLTRKELSGQNLVELQTNTFYQGLTPEQIQYIESWSWSAFFVPFVWALGNKLYLWALGTFVPIFNIYVWIMLASKGRKMAWAKGGWGSFDFFKKRQKIMMWVIIGLSIVYLVFSIAMTYFASTKQPTYNNTTANDLSTYGATTR